MMKNYVGWATVMILSMSQLTAQTIDIVKRGKSAPASVSNSFEFIESPTNLSDQTYIGSIRAAGLDKESSIPKLFFMLKRKARELGANSFTLSKFERDDKSNAAILILDIYLCSDSIIALNRTGQLKNSLVIFIDDSNSGETYEVSINDIKRKIKSGSYSQYNIIKGVDIVIKQSELFGSTFKFKWSENKPVTFITLTDFGLENKDNETDYLGMFFNTKRINTIDSGLGHLLMQLLNKKV